MSRPVPEEDSRTGLLPFTVVHYSKQDPLTTVGGVQTFARNLRRIFADVRFMTPRTAGKAAVMRQRLPVISDNQCVTPRCAGFPACCSRFACSPVVPPARPPRDRTR